MRYCKCCKIIPFVFVPLQICNGTDRCGKPKIIILLDFDVVAVVDDNGNVIIYYFNVQQILFECIELNDKTSDKWDVVK